MIPYKLSCKPWEVVSADIFTINNKRLLCIVDDYSKLPLVKTVGSLVANDLVEMTKMIFVEYGPPRKIFSHTGKNFTSKMFRQFCRQMSMQQSITLSYHHQSNDQVEMCIKFVKLTIKKCLATNQDVSLALLHKINTHRYRVTQYRATAWQANERSAASRHREPMNVNNMMLNMRPSRHLRTNMLRTMTQRPICFFCRIYSNRSAGRCRAMDAWGHRRGEW